MILNFISVYLFLSIMFLSILFVHSFSSSKSSYAKALGLLSLTLQIFLLGYLMEINSESLNRMIFWNKVQYFGIPFFPALWLVVSMLYTGRGKYLKGFLGFIIFSIPTMTFILHMTNDWHHLYYSYIKLQHSSGMKLMLLGKGPWYMVQSWYILIVLLLCSWFYFQRYRKSKKDEKIQFRLLLLSSGLPYLALIFDVMNIGENGLDYTALIFPPCILLINLALTRYNFLEIKLLAREKVFEDSRNGLILLNRYYHIVDFNSASIQFFEWFDVTMKKEESLDSLLINQQELLYSIQNTEDKVFHLIVEEVEHYVHINVRSVQNKEERVGILITVEDITERERLRRSLIKMASTDELSGLNNRRRFRECAEDVYQRAKRYQEHVSVLMMDLDYFKKINDTFGHVAGDVVIQEFSEMLRTTFRGTDVVGRMGGEEFAVVMLDTDARKAYQKAEYFRRKVEDKSIVVDQHPIKVTVSIGIAEFNEDISYDALMNRADSALYEAKRGGRNCSVVDKL